MGRMLMSTPIKARSAVSVKHRSCVDSETHHHLSELVDQLSGSMSVWISGTSHRSNFFFFMQNKELELF